jgi:hypothetical protein
MLLFVAVLPGVLLLPHTRVDADEVCLDGVWHSGVLIAESPAQYYIHFPESGELRRVDRDRLPAEAIRRTSTREERDALRQRWAAARGVADDVAEVRRMRAVAARLEVSPPASSEAEDAQALPPRTLRLRGEGTAMREVASGHASHGMVDSVRLHGVPLRDALDAMLRPLGLDYEIAPYGLYVSTPDRLRHEARERVETRFYPFAPAGETLPKIVVGQLPATTATANLGASGGIGGFGLSGRGVGGGVGRGVAGGVGGRGSGFGTAGFGQGFNNNFGGGLAGGMSPVSQIGNVSQLFRTIDDRIVGEAPAEIAAVGVAR